jgi:hypothetical protein
MFHSFFSSYKFSFPEIIEIHNHLPLYVIGSVNFWHCQFLINPLFSEVLTLFVHKKSDTPFFVYNVNRQTNITKMKVNRSWTLYSTYLI